MPNTLNLLKARKTASEFCQFFLMKKYIIDFIYCINLLSKKFSTEHWEIFKADFQWMAGGGVKAGYTHGATDEIGLQVADKSLAMDTYDLHATVLNQMGLDHLKLNFKYQGGFEQPTVGYGKVIKELIV